MDETCKVCDRVAFGVVTLCGNGHWRHSTCCVGSEAWAVYFGSQDKATKAKLIEFKHYHEVKL